MVVVVRAWLEEGGAWLEALQVWDKIRLVTCNKLEGGFVPVKKKNKKKGGSMTGRAAEMEREEKRVTVHELLYIGWCTVIFAIENKNWKEWERVGAERSNSSLQGKDVNQSKLQDAY